MPFTALGHASRAIAPSLALAAHRGERWGVSSKRTPKPPGPTDDAIQAHAGTLPACASWASYVDAWPPPTPLVEVSVDEGSEPTAAQRRALQLLTERDAAFRDAVLAAVLREHARRRARHANLDEEE